MFNPNRTTNGFPSPQTLHKSLPLQRMLQQFRQFIRDNQLFNDNESILVAVSGGMDSVALCTLFHLAGFPFGIAHCNFRLRGAESGGCFSGSAGRVHEAATAIIDPSA